MRIVIDLQGAQTSSRFRGIGRYSLSLAKSIVRNKKEHEILIALSGRFPETVEPIRAAFYNLLPQENIRIWDAPGPVNDRSQDNIRRREIAEKIREAFLVSLQPDIVYITSLFEGYADDAATSIDVLGFSIPTVVTYYDLIPLHNPEGYLENSPSYKDHYMRKLEYLSKATAFLAISEFSEKEARASIEIGNKLIVNISAACDDVFHKMDISDKEKDQLFKKLLITKPFVMYTGGDDSRKNLGKLFQAYAAIPEYLKNSYQLVIVGRYDISLLKAAAKSAGLKDNEIIFTNFVSDGELAQLYNLCTLFVFPSVHEGFGLPALEAMSCGTPVIGSNLTSLPEVIGNNEALFDPYSVNDISNKITNLLSNKELRSTFSMIGFEQAKKFSWDNSAKRAISAFEKVARTSSGEKKTYNYNNILSTLISSIETNVKKELNSAQQLSIAHSISTSLPLKRQRQFFVDISELVQRDVRTGIQRVTRSILKELLNNPPAGYIVEPVYATTEDNSYRYARNFTANFMNEMIAGDDNYIEFQAGDIFLGLDLQQKITSIMAGFLVFMRQHGVKVYFVIYDLLPIQFPQHWPKVYKDISVHANWIDVISNFDGAACISRSVADELTSWLKNNGAERLRPFDISWFHLGADVENSVPTFGVPDDAERVLNEVSKRSSFLMVGTIEPRKRQTQTLAAFEKLWLENINVNLIIVGQHGWMCEDLIEKISIHPELGKRLFWLKGISDEYLDKIYTAATCLIAASEGEGFGLPLIEAAQHKIAIIARDIPVFREVASDHAFYFSGLEPGDLTEAIKKWLNIYKLDRHPRSDNMKRLTWSESALQLQAALHLNDISH